MGSDDRPDPLVDAALRLTDGQPVDWGEVSTDLDTTRRTIAARLRELERLARAFRGDAEGSTAWPSMPGDSIASDHSQAPRGRAVGESCIGDDSILFTWGPLWALDLLGQGGYGEVYRAFDPRLQRDVALKLLREDVDGDPDALLAEARRLARVRHPNIVTVHGVDAHDGRVGVWFERLEGRDLATVVREDGPLAPERALDLVAQVSAAVRAVHDAGWVHGDIKAANVVLEPGGRPVLVDFGAGRPISASGALFGGTPLVLPPEALRGKALGPEGDVYALAVLLFHLLSGGYPVFGETLDALLSAHDGGAARRIRDLRPDVPAAVDALLAQALAFDPGERPRDLRAWIDALETCRRRVAEVLRTLVATDPLEGDDEASAEGAPSLPTPEFAFVGRTAELDEISFRLSSHRVVTLVGPGGAGKTRLALEWCRQRGRRLAQRIVWVDLSALQDAERLAQAIGDAMGLTDTAPGGLDGRVRDALSREPTLLVLDNCEHVRSHCAAFVKACFPGPGLPAEGPLPENSSRVLATSREALRVPDEAAFPVPPLGIPEESVQQPERLIEYESVELLVRRFRDIDPGFRLDAKRAEPVARIARRLDGLPLALELAAGRLRVLPVEQIAERLEDRFRLLTGGRARHRTLRAMVDWSYESLTPEERTLFARLAVFAGGWTVDAMEAVCAGEAFEGSGLLDAFTGLREKFLVTRDPTFAGGNRFRMLETLREYARDQLAAAGEREDLGLRHARHCRGEIERIGPLLRSDRQPEGIALIAADHENHLLAVETLSRRAEAEFADGAESGRDRTVEVWRLVDALGFYWWVRGQWGQAVRTLDRVISLPGPDGPTVERVQVRLWRGHFASSRGDTDLARQELESALAEARSIGSRALVGRALSYRGQLAYAEGRYDDASRLMEEALAIHRARGDRRAVSIMLASLGNTAEMRGDSVTAVKRFDESLALARASGDDQNAAYSMQRLAALAVSQGRFDDAERIAREAQPLVDALDNPWGRAAVELVLGDVALRRGDREAAAARFRDSLGEYERLGDSGSALRVEVRLGYVAVDEQKPAEAIRWLSSALSRLESLGTRRDLIGIVHGYGDVAIQAGDSLRAATLYGASEAMGARQGVELWREEQDNLDRCRALLLSENAGAEVRCAWQAGGALTDDEVVALCRAIERQVGP